MNLLSNKEVLMNKKGKGYHIIALPWLFLLFLAGLGVVWIVGMFYGSPYDVREIEARLLLNKVADCVSYAGRINPALISKEGINQNPALFLERCHLNFNSDEEFGQYFVEVKIYDIPSNSLLIEMKKGNNDLKEECNLQKVTKYPLSSQCYEQEFNSFSEMNKKYNIQILTAVKKLEKNVKK